VKAQHFHAGELEAQQRFNPDWNAEKSQRLGRIIGDTLDQRMTDFIARQTFFFLATADAEGHCDCSFKGTESAADGQALPAVWVTEPRRLLFPDYAGNRLFNSLGNILATTTTDDKYFHADTSTFRFQISNFKRFLLYFFCFFSHLESGI
jgi:hypothetical protein